MRRWYDEEHDMKMCEPDCADEWLFDIWAIGCDYDGCRSAKDLKKLVDELVDMAGKARGCLWDGQLFGVHGMPKPKANRDRIRAMSDEELAEFLAAKFADLQSQQLHQPTATQLSALAHTWYCQWMYWLRQPVKDGDNDVD